jgi:hypothetical protein
MTMCEKIMFWGYLHQNGSIHAKRWFGDQKDYTEDCEANDFVEQVVQPFAANTREQALGILESIFFRRQQLTADIKKVYLGDSVYAKFDGFHIVLTTENGLPSDPSNVIALAPDVQIALVRFIENLVLHRLQVDICQCQACQSLFKEENAVHYSSCSVHNEPASPNGECDCEHCPIAINDR